MCHIVFVRQTHTVQLLILLLQIIHPHPVNEKKYETKHFLDVGAMVSAGMSVTPLNRIHIEKICSANFNV